MNNFEVGVLEPSVLSYKWEVKNFSTKSAGVQVDRLISPVFSTKYADSKLEWRLWLYPNGNKEDNKDHLSIFIEYLGEISQENSITAHIAFSILNLENKSIFRLVMKDRLFKTGAKSWGMGRFIKRNFIMDEKNLVLEDDTLKILCEIDFNSKPTLEEPIIFDDESNVEEEQKELNDRLKEFDDFEKLFESEAFCDMTFIVEEKKIHAHKAILVSRSPVFEVMLQRYTKDKPEDTFEITGIKYDVMKELLRFMYVGKVNDIDQQASGLLVAADKYSITGLKALCEKVLYKNLCLDNALEYLNLATVCDATVLKSQIIEFIASNLEDIVDKPGFELFGDLNSKVICEVVRAIAKKNSK